MTELSPKDRAERAAQALWAQDAASQWLGFTLSEVDAGRAVLTLTIAPHHCNGHGTCHGGITFALADSAFAFACNSRNQSTVAQHNVISYVAPARAGDVLTAVAQEVSLIGRSGIYDVRVSDQTDRVIAEFRGMSRQIKGQLFDEQEGS